LPLRSPPCVCERLQNFFPGPVMDVAIGTQPCGGVVVTDNATLGELTCVAPPGPGFGAVQLRVVVQGSGTGSIRFSYDAPVVAGVVGSPCDASATCPVQVGAIPACWPIERSNCCSPSRRAARGVTSCPRPPCVDAVLLAAQIVGVNLGSRSALTGPEPVVFVGECTSFACFRVGRVRCLRPRACVPPASTFA
jgi:hypothetical protein